LIHLGNFPGMEFHKILPALLVVIPQFIAGIIPGYLRIRYGFIYAVVFHFVINLTLLFQL